MNGFGLSYKYGNKTFDEWTWLTAHNSHINEKDSGVLYYLVNQEFDLEKQLEIGVRGFMFDLYLKKCSVLETFFKTCNCEGICLCHGECSDSIKDGFKIKSFDYFLKKIVTFLNKNKEEIVTIFLENYVVDVKSMQDVFKKTKTLNRLVFDPYSSDWNVSSMGWPKIEEMIKKNKRLLIIDDEKRGQHAEQSPGIIRSRDFCIENHFEWFRDKYTWVNFTIQNDVLKYKNSLNESFDGNNLNMEMSRCLSWYRFNREPLWDEENPLILNTKEHSKQVLNANKLFIFNHFFGIRAFTSFIDRATILLMNKKEFILKRIKEKCDPGTNGKKPNYIALDFIDENIYKDLIEPLNNN